MNTVRFRRWFTVALAVVLCCAMMFSAFSLLGFSAAANKADVHYDDIAYPVDENRIFPTHAIMHESWGWNCDVTATEDYLSIFYKQSLPQDFTLAVKEITPNHAHIKMAVENASRFYISFGGMQAHAGRSLTLYFAIDRSAKTVNVGLHGGKSTTDTGVTAFDEDSNIDITIEQKKGGYLFTFNDDYVYELTDSALATNEILKNLFENGNLWMNIAPNNSAPDFRIYSVHSGDEICYDTLAETFSAEQMNAFFGVARKIGEIDSSVTVNSKAGIEAARLAYDELIDDLKPYVYNYDKLVYAEKALETAIREEVNMDSYLYGAEMSNIGPVRYWGKETVDWYAAASGLGTTVEFNNVTVHNVSLNVDRPLSLDGIHYRFANGTYTGSGESFALNFYNGTQIDMANPNRKLWLLVNISAAGLKIQAAAVNQPQITIVDTAQITKADFEQKWDFRLTRREDGSYAVTVNSLVTGVIPTEYIESAVNAGLDTENIYITLGGNNFGGASGKLQLDCLSFHDKNSTCTDELFDKYGIDAITNLRDAVVTIDSIKTPITLDSGMAILQAENAYNALPEELRGYVTAYDKLVTFRKMYDKLENHYVNRDKDVYPPTADMVGPNHYWSTDTVDWFAAASGAGVTMKFRNTTVHGLSLTYKKPAVLDGLHMLFANGTYDCQSRVFVLMFDQYDQIDYLNNGKDMWLTFDLSDDNVKIYISAYGKSARLLIGTPYVTAKDFEEQWDIRFEKLEDGSYRMTLNGIVSGIIPADYIAAARESGMNESSVNVTFGSCNLGNAQPYNIDLDYVAYHSGSENCYCQVLEGDCRAAEQCESLIDAIGDVSAESGDAIKRAQDAFDALGAYLQGLVSNADSLKRKSEEYNQMASDIVKALKVDVLIDNLSESITEDTYDQYLTAYFEYLDLFPRIRKYVNNSVKLLGAVAAYEKAHPGLNLSNESMNAYTGGRKAHYLSANATSSRTASDMVLRSPQTGESRTSFYIYLAVLILSGCLMAVLGYSGLKTRKKTGR